MRREQLKRLEEVIEKNQRSFYVIGKALKQIRDERLYREYSYDLFEHYTKSRWDMGKSHAYRLIEAYQIIVNLSPIGEILPENEAQTRPLARLSAFDQRKFWREFTRSESILKASTISRCVTTFLGMKETESGIDLTKIITNDYYAAVMVVLEQIKKAQNDSWKGTSRPAALFWNKVMKEKILWNP